MVSRKNAEQRGHGQTVIVSVPPSFPPVEQYAFRNEGHYWRLVFGGQGVTLKDSIGLKYIRYLLQHPHVEISALQLVAAVSPATQGDVPRSAALNQRQLDEEGLAVSELSDAGDVLDKQAISELNRRREDMQGELERAESAGNPEQIVEICEEMDQLRRALSEGTGHYGHARKAVDPSERARKGYLWQSRAATVR